MTRLLPSSRRIAAALTRVAGALAVLGAVSTASAHPTSPGVIQDQLGAPCAPQCSLCHVSAQGGDALRGEGPVGYVGPHQGYGQFITNLLYQQKPYAIDADLELKTKLKGLEKLPCNAGDADTGICDSDGDGTSDIDELKAGDDPDEKGHGNGAICPKYGCGASSIATLPRNTHDSSRAGAVMAALGVALIFARRFRR